MVSLTGIKGQPNAVKFLKNSITSGRLADSYLFWGPEGVGKAMAAGAFVSALMCVRSEISEGVCGACPSCLKTASRRHPDLTWILPEKNKAIKIEQIRKVKEVLSLKPFEAPVSVCVIENAHLMTTQASNALLKVLEEPPGESMLVLISDRKEMLIDTVVSRCSEVRFNALSPELTKCLIRSAMPDIDEDEAEFLSYFCQGSPGRALQMKEDGLLERKDAILSMLEEISSSGEAACLNWDNDNKDVLIEDIDLMMVFFRDIALAGAGVETVRSVMSPLKPEDMARSYTPERIYELMGTLIELRRSLMGNVNAKLAGQALPGIIGYGA